MEFDNNAQIKLPPICPLYVILAINVHTKILHDKRATVYINEKYIKSSNYF